MMNDKIFVNQTLSTNLYYLRTIREFALNIQLSFLDNNQMYIDTALDFGERCEELGRILMKYANGNISNKALEEQIFVTNYTLDTELLTEKLFSVDIDTTITENELSLKGGSNNKVSEEMLNDLSEVNASALILVTNFINFCEDIVSKMVNNELFAYSYISLIEAMLIEANLYTKSLNRLISRDNLTPTFVIDYEYLFNDLLGEYASFIRGLVDPKDAEIIIRSGAFANEFSLLANDYKNAVLSPEIQEDLKGRSLDIVERFRIFLSGIIEGVLSSEIYFIVEPLFLDNILTSTNYFKYALTS